MTKTPVLRLASLGLLLSTAVANACVITTETDDETTSTGTTSGTTSSSGSTDSTSGTDSASTTTTTSGDSSATGSSDTDSTVPLQECNRDLTPTMIVTESDITTPTTWSGVVVVDASISIYEGATLTIAPGTTVLLNQDVDLTIGWNSGAATLLAQGSADAPIFFCGKNLSGTIAKWGGMIVESNVTSNSSLQHVYVDDAGSNDRYALDLQAGILVQDVVISDSAVTSLRAVDFKAGSARLSVTGAGDYPVEITGEGAFTNFPVGGSLTGNTIDHVKVSFDTIDDDATIHDVGIPYAQSSNLYLYDKTLNVDAGVDYLFDPDTLFDVGWNSNAGALLVNGTAENPVTFGGTTAEKGWWHGVWIEGNVKSNSKLSYLTIRDAGGESYPSLDVDAAITLDHVTVRDGVVGVNLSEAGLNAASTALTVTGMDEAPLELMPDAVFSIPADGSYSGNALDVVTLLSGNITKVGTIAALNVPYHVDGDVYTYEDSKVTIAAGTTFKMGADSSIEFGWNSGQAEVTAVGTALAPITFEGLDPVAGSWENLIVGNNVLSSSKFEYVSISHGGKDGRGSLQLGTALSVTNSTFANSAGYGITKEASDMSDYTVSNTFTDNALGNVGDI